jgi:hypothetical protein
VPPGYAGEWTGTTAEGTPVRFSVSAGDLVTAVSLTYRFPGSCAGSIEVNGLAVPIHKLDPPGPPPFDQPGFAFGKNNVTSGWAINGHFSPDRRSASGQFLLVRYGTCGTVTSTWNARRR